MTQKPKLIAFDLDGTLLDSRKGLSARSLRALARAGAQGALLVPATGRIPAGMPEPLLGLPGFRWGILSNGAELYDFAEARIAAREEVPLETALRLLDEAQSLGVPYDCYQDNWGYMTEAFLRRAPDFAADPGILDLILRLRSPVPELRAYLREKGKPVQKLQLYFTDGELRRRLLRELPGRYPELSVTSSLPFNIELNSARANKGEALQSLCALLGIDPADTLAFGDGGNDLTLLRGAGCGVAMANAAPEVLRCADRVTASNDEDGVAAVLEEIYG